MRVDLFDFDLPDDRIALRPCEPRDAARLLVVCSGGPEPLSDRHITDLPDLLRPGDCLVFNDTKVIPARLIGVRHRENATGARIEVTLYDRLDGTRWQCLARPLKRLKPGDAIRFGADESLAAEIEAVGDGGEVTLAFATTGAALDAAIAAVGYMPLPPYIAGRRDTDDRDREDYQTVYAQHEGAVAAPTAGLHFTSRLLEQIEKRGIACEYVTLHVGPGTFLPVKADDTRGHQMHAERGEISPEIANRLNAVRGQGGRVIAVGTTSLRLLESAAGPDGEISAFSGATDIFITPGYRFRAIDGLLTNFHLPRSTLFMLVSAFCGLNVMKSAYRHAIDEGYRFYSYGDASLLWPQPT